ncbi:hypothetical protein CHELA40_15070 [Chelatococcus asaccharovorans]|nr:hypothetical protein CHELA17_60551 [Chelatococcus asaccharovorans]CAH1681411.1 hypothetical protein CHELA40_15070 [Chelatococcus asaccharovorans]
MRKQATGYAVDLRYGNRVSLARLPPKKAADLVWFEASGAAALRKWRQRYGERASAAARP